MNENEMNLLENQLRSWQPRRPSPRLKRKLFGSASPGEAAGISFRWLAPAVACLFLALTIVNQEPGLSASSVRHQPLMGMVSSDLSYTNLLPEDRPAGRNGVSPASFEWTNRSGFTSSISPFSPGRMN
jgi:hypothetical protein